MYKYPKLDSTISNIVIIAICKPIKANNKVCNKHKDIVGQQQCCMCRSFLSPWKNENNEYQIEGRFNIGVCSINLPQVAILSGGNKELFFNILAQRLDMAEEVGLLRYHKLKDTKASAAPILWQGGALARLGPNDTIGHLIPNGRASVSIGYIGLNEVCEAMCGESITHENGNAFAHEVLDFMNAAARKMKERTKLSFGLYGTPELTGEYMVTCI